MAALLELEDLRVYYPIRRGLLNRVVAQLRAVDGISLELPEGETLGLVGESGCGKTTLGRALVGLEPIYSGSIRFAGEDITRLGGRQRRRSRRQMQMVFQDPFSSLNPRLSAMELLVEGLVEHGLCQGKSRETLAAALMSEVGLDSESMYRFPHEFSGGQRQRLSIARALSLQPRFIVCDEAVSALDVSVQAQILRLLLDLRQRHQLTYLFISHDLSVVRLMAQRLAVMYLGHLVEYGACQEILDFPLHPYTQALISAIPVPGVERRGSRIILSGDPPSPVNPPSGCPFHPRCPRAIAICRSQMPALLEHEQRRVACHLVHEAHEAAAATFC